MKPHNVEYATIDGRSRGGIISRAKNLLAERRRQYEVDRQAIAEIRSKTRRIYQCQLLDSEREWIEQTGRTLDRLAADGVELEGSAIETR